jgi:hypothetical protein
MLLGFFQSVENKKKLSLVSVTGNDVKTSVRNCKFLLWYAKDKKNLHAFLFIEKKMFSTTSAVDL